MTNAKFDLHLPGLIKILAENLYSDPRVGLRELLQNSHDSISRRQIEQPKWRDAPSIRIHVNKTKNAIEIQDNGSGLTREETVTYLATIGRGYTRELRERLAFEDTERYNALIGQFGLGFLSAFLLAESVEVETLSYKPKSTPVLWKSQGSESYQLNEGERTEIGTTVRLKLKPAMRYLVNESTLDELVKRFADLLTHPVYVSNNSHRSNSGIAPWNAEDIAESLQEFLTSRGNDDEPLWFMRLTDQTLSLEQETITVPLAGIIYIPPRSIASVQEHGDAMVFIRNMFIREGDRRLLPRWARFARAIVESPMLTPTVSREDIHEDENLNLVTQAIEQQFLAAFDQLSRERSSRWNQILDAHANLIMAWGAENRDFFNRIVKRVKLPTSRGQLTIGEYLKQTKSKSIYFQADETPRLSDQVLLEGCGKPVIDATWYGILPFLERYEAENKGVRLVQADTDIPSLIRTVKDKKFQDFLGCFKESPYSVQIGEFEPASLPAVLVFDRNAEFLRQVAERDEDLALPPGVEALLDSCAEEMQADGQTPQGTLYLNAKSSLINKLAKQAQNDTLNDTAFQLLYQAVRLFSDRQMDAKRCMEVWADLCKSLETLLK